MDVLRHDRWTRSGLSLLWGAEALSKIAVPGEVASIRGFFAMRRSWLEELPSLDGNALIVAGLEGCLDCLTREDAATWLEQDVKPALLDFQEFYGGEAALILWIPSGRKRIGMEPATERYFWKLPPSPQEEMLDLGRCLWAGADADVQRILVPGQRGADPDGPAWIGLHQRRIS